MGFSSFSAFAPKRAPSPRRCGLVFLASALGACASVYYSHTPGIPFDTNLFAALGMVPGAILCVLLLLLPYGGWRSCLLDTLICVILAPIICALKNIDIALFPAIVWGFLLGVGISYPVYAFFSALKIKTDGNVHADGQRPIAGKTGSPK